MFGGAKKPDDYLNQLAIKLTASAHQLSETARRLQLAELTHREYLTRLRKLDQHLRHLIALLQDPRPDPVTGAEPDRGLCDRPPQKPSRKKKLSYADYIEFSNYAELKKFEQMQDISEEDIRSCDTDELLRRLMEINEDEAT